MIKKTGERKGSTGVGPLRWIGVGGCAWKCREPDSGRKRTETDQGHDEKGDKPKCKRCP